ncbi:MAG: hypothetical protein HC927_03735 [Deltaproteobacteria bacterium]|nr:hypothetical protein [Deltaproteobacteria bacterium]
MTHPLAAGIVFGYLAIALVVGVLAGRQGKGDTSDFVAGERSFGPLVMYFVIGATIFSAYALLGTPQRVVAKGSDAFYVSPTARSGWSRSSSSGPGSGGSARARAS